ncbi:MAG: glycerate kinase, partial [Bacteroidota bacterium]
MKVLLAPDKFKGSLTAQGVCEALAKGILKSNPKATIITQPMADGGDGTLAILDHYFDLTTIAKKVQDPLGRPITATYKMGEGKAYVEMAVASGLALLAPEERNCMRTSTYGTGQLIADALAKGATEIFLFLGGSATNDGGMGIASALGYDFLDKDEQILQPIGANLPFIKTIKRSTKFNFEDTTMTLLCDVTNPLYGLNGAAHVYAPQKGATIKQVEYLDRGLRNFSQVVQRQLGKDVSDLSGGGAAGGIGAGLTALFRAKMEKGFAVIAQLTDLEQSIQQADLVISGEGKLDHQSLQGKVIDGVVQLCQKYGKPLALFVGKNDLPTKVTNDLGIKFIFSIAKNAKDLEDAMVNGAKHLAEMAQIFTASIIKKN